MYNKLKEKLHHFLNTPQQLFWFYIGMNLIPSICLTFTEPFTFMGKFLLILFPLGFYFILFSSIKNTGLLQLLLFPLLFLHAFQLVLFYLFGEAVIAVDMFLNIATTNVSEASELLDNIWPAVVLVCILYIPTTIIAAIACKHKVHTSRTFRRKMIFAGILLLLITYGLTFCAQNKNTGKFTFKEDLYPTNIFYNLGFAFNKWHKSENYPETSKDFTFDAQKDIHPGKREIYILVVGEASRQKTGALTVMNERQRLNYKVPKVLFTTRMPLPNRIRLTKAYPLSFLQLLPKIMESSTPKKVYCKRLRKPDLQLYFYPIRRPIAPLRISTPLKPTFTIISAQQTIAD